MVYELKKYISQLRSTVISSCECIPEKMFNYVLTEEKKALLESLEIECREPVLVSWPVFFESFPAKVKETQVFNVCAITFGALIILQDTDFTAIGDDDVKKILSRVVRTLIILQNQDGSWPSDFDAEYLNKTKTGTINQTTLALATLVKIGFFEKISPVSGKVISDEALENRLKFAESSIDCLYKAAYKTGNKFAWRHTISQVDDIPPSILPTSNVINVLCKMKKVFSGKASLIEDGDEIVRKLEKMIDGAFQWIAMNQNDDGSFCKSGFQEPSFSYTCMAATVCMTDYGKNEEVIEKAIRYLTRFKYSKLIHKEPESEYYDKIVTYVYQDEDKKKKEVSIHEIFIESSYALALLNYYKFKRAGGESRLRLSRIKSEINRMIKQICQRKCHLNELYLIKGRREAAFQYPIYCIYYAVVTFKYYLSQEKELIPLNPKIIIAAVFAVTFLVSYTVLSIIRTGAFSVLFSILLSIATSFLANMVSRATGL